MTVAAAVSGQRDAVAWRMAFTHHENNGTAGDLVAEDDPSDVALRLAGKPHEGRQIAAVVQSSRLAAEAVGLAIGTATETAGPGEKPAGTCRHDLAFLCGHELCATGSGCQ